MHKYIQMTPEQSAKLHADAAAAMAAARRRTDQKLRARGYRYIGRLGDELLYTKDGSTPPG